MNASVIETTAECMVIYQAKAAQFADQTFASAEIDDWGVYGHFIAGYLTAAATIHAAHVLAVQVADAVGALHQGFEKIATSIECASDDAGTVIEAAIGSLDATLVGIDAEIGANGRQTNERLRGIEVGLEGILSELLKRPSKG